jgi:hypothetical protein
VQLIPARPGSRVLLAHEEADDKRYGGKAYHVEPVECLALIEDGEEREDVLTRITGVIYDINDDFSLLWYHEYYMEFLPPEVNLATYNADLLQKEALTKREQVAREREEKYREYTRKQANRLGD